mmetsp:Transcript_14085/g.26846  ORF Transcript_14085/g.26846 Transcript_14085/m.26846 type:complete len:329 (-) Transcript_14085:98-1084(-)
MKQLLVKNQDLDLMILESARATDEYDSLRQQIEQFDEELTAKKRAVERIRKELQVLEREKTRFKAEAQRAAPLNEWKERMTQEWVPQDIEDIDTKISEFEIQLESNMEDNSVIERYKKLEEKIASLTMDTDRQTAELNEARESIETKKNEWLPGINQLCEQISTAYSKHFEKMGCQGEVRVKEDEDFEKYGLEIWVQFRKGAELQRLSKFTQSGGERSVSTMLYLLCLQSVTETPFRVVDEINQGMDSKNERMIFDRIVASCALDSAGPDAPQYFLVTPKLLPNLQYPPGADIAVLCVYNGCGMLPAETWSPMSTELRLKSRKRKTAA